MKQKVIIKSNKYGLIVHMDPDAEYTEILKELRKIYRICPLFQRCDHGGYV